MAVVQGVAYGGGVGLVACCDVAVASARISVVPSRAAFSKAVAVVGGVVGDSAGTPVLATAVVALLVLVSLKLEADNLALARPVALAEAKGPASLGRPSPWTYALFCMPVLAAALFARFSSRQEDSPSIKAVAALRNQFGGHAVTQAGPSSGTSAVSRPTTASTEAASRASTAPRSRASLRYGSTRRTA